MWDIENKALEHTFEKAHEGKTMRKKCELLEFVFALAVNHQSTFLISGAYTEIKIWDITTKTLAHSIPKAHNSRLQGNFL